jgi:hypothetical protein
MMNIGTYLVNSVELPRRDKRRRGRDAAEGELQQWERRPIFLNCGDLAILCKAQNTCWFSESTEVLRVMVVNIGVVLYA